MPLTDRDPIAVLHSEARRKPQIAELIANVHDMTADEIKAVKVLPWIKNTLLEIKKMGETDKIYKSMMAYLADKIIDSVLPDSIGETRRWLLDQDYIIMGTGVVEIKPNQMVWFGENGVWLDTVFSKTIDSKLRNTAPVGMMTKQDYFGMERARRNGQDAPTQTLVYGPEAVTSAPKSPVAGMFTIYRPA